MSTGNCDCDRVICAAVEVEQSGDALTPPLALLQDSRVVKPQWWWFASLGCLHFCMHLRKGLMQHSSPTARCKCFTFEIGAMN